MLEIVLILTIIFIIIASVYLLINMFPSISKKKMKDKRIMVKVVYVSKDNARPTYRFFSATDDLSTCVMYALCYAKRHHLQIKSMELLTTK